ncbi:MAG: cytochrome c-type biogenesis protein CcmH [Actinobacteria bacterium]|nr:cytochrome c-type biogenesis protein CcmH [Actinomycetota bacterium]
MRLGRWSLVAAGMLAVAALVVAAGSNGTDDSASARVEHLSEQLRCPTCQGLSVADSPASTARAIREDVARRVAAGETDAEIKAAYVDRYGEWILLRPRGSGVAVVVWAVPVAALVLAGAGLAAAFRRWRRQAPAQPTADDRALVERELDERGRVERARSERPEP